MPPDLIPVVGFMMVAGTIAVLGTSAFVVIRRVMTNTSKPAVAPDDRVADLEGRVSELEERLDFHERVLTDIKGQAKLEPGSEQPEPGLAQP